MKFGMIILNQNIKTMQKYVIWILTVLLFVWKPKSFMRKLEMVLKNGFTNYNKNDERPLPKCMNKKVIELMKDDLERLW